MHTVFPSIMMIAFSLLDNNLIGITFGAVSFFTDSFTTGLLDLDSFFVDKSIEFTTRPVKDDSVVNKNIYIHTTNKEFYHIHMVIFKGIIFRGNLVFL